MASVVEISDTRRTIRLPIDEGVIAFRGLSPQRHRFELEYALERGSTANSVFFEAGDGSPAVLVHPPGAAYRDTFLPAFAEALPSSDAPLLVVVGHINPNRVALLRDLEETYAGLELVVSNAGAKLIDELWNQRKPAPPGEESEQPPLPPRPPLRVIRQEETLPLSQGRNLLLLPAPTPRWPGGLLAFEETLGLLMSGKFFSAHLCTETWAEDNRSSTEVERRHFYDSLMAPMARKVELLVERLEELDIRTIAPGHGPAIDTSWRSLLNDYRRWGESQQQSNLTVLLLFASAYGNTAAIADALGRGVTRTTIRVNCLNCEFTPADELISAIQSADGVLIGSPTLGGHAPTPVVSALGTLLAEGDRNKPVGVFGSYGWSGEAVDLLETKLRDGGFRFGFDPIRIKFSPDRTKVKELEETGTRFARQLLKAEQRAKRRNAGGMSESRSNPAIQALGRVVGSLSILTTKKGDLSGAMVASWVSQASFTPPGLTVAVAKDRAVESLLQKGDCFAMNLLAEGRESGPMKQFLQPFDPGADRFAGLELEQSPSEQPLLPEALAWLECNVKQRMECGDHWLLYAEVTHGGVFDADSTTAVHHRRSGANY
ncbi:MAG: Putative diflavin flavoprotein A 5 [Synechococcus sp. CC9902]|nr:MAG: Putative diflavin flavoprotein A 5 [Synechococcus sp. CC9902]